ncbi:Protein phosphatase type 2C alpha 2 [Fasciola gigantica]|uniref:Protein phosphatase type 2C alpha 2 n=1 Tax=Fasciola gigantica TaxID=46835 RepID=A0A504YFS7_FASGI|nr:Protein phosphatase type 2C alpha 2 [Fasciola gigantica]
MGALLGTPKTEKYNETGSGNGLRYGIASMQGWRVSMEDAHCAITQLPGNLKDWSFFAVFDGHAGALVSAMCATELLKCIVDTEEFKKIDPDLAPSLPEIERGIRDGFLSLDDRLRQLPQVASGEDKSGSTAVCVLITPKHIFFANCGDSRAVLIRQGEVAFATVDHKPINPSEKERIQNAGGSVIVERVNGSLAVSRSIGDYAYKAVKGLGPTEQLISPEPEITVLNRNKELDEIIVLACDGIWDVLSNEALCSLLQHRMRCTDDLSLVCNETIDMCLYKGSSDNMSIVLVAFDPAPRTDPKCKSEDEKVEEVLFERAKKYLETTREQPSMESVLAHLQTFPEPQIPPFLVFCKGGKIQKLLDEFTSPNQPNGGYSH